MIQKAIRSVYRGTVAERIEVGPISSEVADFSKSLKSLFYESPGVRTISKGLRACRRIALIILGARGLEIWESPGVLAVSWQ